MPPIARKFLAEFIGTFWLVFGGCGAAVFAAGVPGVGIGYVGVSFAFGPTVMTMATERSISSAHPRTTRWSQAWLERWCSPSCS